VWNRIPDEVRAKLIALVLSQVVEGKRSGGAAFPGSSTFQGNSPHHLARSSKIGLQNRGSRQEKLSVCQILRETLYYGAGLYGISKIEVG
jgi:hypothetical protein